VPNTSPSGGGKGFKIGGRLGAGPVRTPALYYDNARGAGLVPKAADFLIGGGLKHI